MSVAVERDALLAALLQVADVVEARSTIPVLSNLLIEAADGRMTITGTDLHMQVSAVVAATGELVTTVAKDKLLAAVQSFRAGDLTIAQIEGRSAVTVKQGRGQRTLPTLAADNFPARKAVEGGTVFDMPAPTLRRMLDIGGIAQSSEEVRYYLCGIYFHVLDGRLHAVSSDGHRLIRATIDPPHSAEQLPGLILGTKAVKQIRKLVAKAEGSVSIRATDERIVAAIGGVTVNAALVEGTYPDYTRIIPPVADNAITIQRDALLGPIDAVAAVINPEGDKIKVRGLTFTLSEGEEGLVSAKDQSGADASEPLALTYAGVPIIFGANKQYLASLAGAMADGATLTITIADPKSALLITSDKDPDVTAMMMPMRA